MRDRIEQMIDIVRRYPLARITVPAELRPGLDDETLDRLERSHNVQLGAALREFYNATDGFTFFWKVPDDRPQEMIERYNDVVVRPTTRIDWEMTHGIMIPPLAVVLAEQPFGPLFLGERSADDRRLWAGRDIGEAEALASVHAFDRFLAHNNEDGCMALLMLPDADPRVVGVTDSGMVDPRRPWMPVATYLDLILTMGGEYGSRYDLMDFDTLPPGELSFTPEQIAQFGRDIFRPL